MQVIEDRLTDLSELSDYLGTGEAEAKESLAAAFKVLEGRLAVAALAEQILENHAEYFPPDRVPPGRDRRIPTPLRWNEEKQMVEWPSRPNGGRPKADGARYIENAFCGAILEKGSYGVTQAVRDRVVERLGDGLRLSLPADQRDTSPGGYLDRTCRNFVRDHRDEVRHIRDAYLRRQEARADA